MLDRPEPTEGLVLLDRHDAAPHHLTTSVVGIERPPHRTRGGSGPLQQDHGEIGHLHRVDLPEATVSDGDVVGVLGLARRPDGALDRDQLAGGQALHHRVVVGGRPPEGIHVDGQGARPGPRRR